MSIFDDLMRDVVAPEEDTARTRWSFVAALVTATHAGPPPTVDVDISGGTVPALRYPSGAAPQVGDPVWVAVKGTSAMFVAVVLAP